MLYDAKATRFLSIEWKITWINCFQMFWKCFKWLSCIWLVPFFTVVTVVAKMPNNFETHSFPSQLLPFLLLFVFSIVHRSVLNGSKAAVNLFECSIELNFNSASLKYHFVEYLMATILFCAYRLYRWKSIFFPIAFIEIQMKKFFHLIEKKVSCWANTIFKQWNVVRMNLTAAKKNGKKSARKIKFWNRERLTKSLYNIVNANKN